MTDMDKSASSLQQINGSAYCTTHHMIWNAEYNSYWCDGHDSRWPKPCVIVPISYDPPARTFTAAELATYMDLCADDQGQWNGADLCDLLASAIEAAGGFARCEIHGCYSVANTKCPFDHGNNKHPNVNDELADLASRTYFDQPHIEVIDTDPTPSHGTQRPAVSPLVWQRFAQAGYEAVWHTEHNWMIYRHSDQWGRIFCGRAETLHDAVATIINLKTNERYE